MSLKPHRIATWCFSSCCGWALPWYHAYRSRRLYASHLPVLIGVARACSAGRVLELGSGAFSTRALVDRTVFPSVRHVHSLEDDPEWAAAIWTKLGRRANWTLEQVVSIPQWVATADLSHYDLIFIDNAVDVRTRAETIEHVVRRARGETVVVVHDFETPAYREAVPTGMSSVTFSVPWPATGVMWCRGDWHHEFERLRRVIATARRISPTRYRAWRDILHAESRACLTSLAPARPGRC